MKLLLDTHAFLWFVMGSAKAFVEEGWATDVNELLAEALRRYLESHSSQLSETFIREDVEWGLN
jgi:PIN domain nuclease of toxin-antitoxin system